MSTATQTAQYVASATASGREGRAVTSDGRLDVTLAAPRELGGSGEGTNPEQLFAAGYAACFASALGLVARQRRVEDFDVAVTADVSLSGSSSTGFGLGVVLHVELPEGIDRAARPRARRHRAPGVPLLQRHARQHPRRDRRRLTRAPPRSTHHCEIP